MDPPEQKEEDPSTPANQQEQQLKEKQRRAFNDKVFGCPNPGMVDLPSRKSSSELTDGEWNKIVHILGHWNQDDKAAQTKFRKENRAGYSLDKKFEVIPITLPSGVEAVQLQRKEYKKKNGGKILIPYSKVFDAIYDAHQEKGHLKVSPTWIKACKTYANITEKQVMAFISFCPICDTENPIIKPLAGAKKPIISELFRDRFQVDLIDMRKRRKKNIHGVMMRWLMTVKDHLTGFTMFWALPRKRPKYVAAALDYLFGLIGFPSIFHTDNGSEFTAKEILQMLKELCPSILTVTGRPRKPSDQGSVENMNKLAKRMLHSMEQEEKLKGNVPNWTRLLGRMMGVVNSQKQKGANAVSSYDAVFGMPFSGNLDMLSEPVNLRACDTIEQRLKLANSSRFEQMAREHYEIDSEKKEPSFDEEVYWEASSDEGSAAASVLSDDDDDKVESVDPDVTKPDNRHRYTMDQAWSSNRLQKPRTLAFDNKTFNFVFATLLCDCCFLGTSSLWFGDADYLNQLCHTKREFETDFIATFCNLVGHTTHKLTTQVVHCQNPGQALQEKECETLSSETVTVVSVLHGIGHFSVLELSLQKRSIMIYDGLNYSLTTWFKHAFNVLKRCKLIPIETVFVHPTICNSNCEFQFGDVTWTLAAGERFLKQHDGNSCGPIACLKIMEMFGVLSKSPTELQVMETGQLRLLVLTHYKKMIEGLQSDEVFVAHRKVIALKAETKSTAADPDAKSSNISDYKTPRKNPNKQSTAKSASILSTPRSSTSRHRRAVVLLKKERQKKQALVMQKAWLDTSSVVVGDAVAMKMDFRGVSHPRAVLGVVYEVSGSGAGGIRVATEHGIVCRGLTKASYFVPSDRYKILANAVLSTALEDIQLSVRSGTFDPEAHPKTTMQQAHAATHNETPGGRMKCSCKTRKCDKCKCARAGVACTSSCACNDTCQNKHNDK